MATALVAIVVGTALLALLVVGFHEWGHYIFAKKLNIGVKRISIGMGRPIFKKKLSTGGEFVIGWFLLGGYVSLLNEREAPVKDIDKPYAFNRQPLGARAIVLAAGPVASLVLAVLLYSIVFFVGFKVVKPVTENVVVGSIASKAGIARGDEIIAVEGWSTQSLVMANLAIASHIGSKRPILFVVRQSSGKKRTFKLDMSDLRLYRRHQSPLELLGVEVNRASSTAIYRYSLGTALLESVLQTGRIIGLNGLLMFKIFTGKLALSALAGPLMLINAAGLYLLEGIVLFLQFAALFSVAVSIVNLIPIPGLDGGHLFLLLIEKFRGKPLELATEVLLYRLSCVALAVLFVQLLANDLARLF